MEQGPTRRRKRLVLVKISWWMSRRVFVTNFAWVSVFGNSASNAAGEGRALVSTTWMSDVFCINDQSGPPNTRRASLGSLLYSRPPDKKSGRPLTPKRPAFAFLVTPKLPLGGRS